MLEQHSADCTRSFSFPAFLDSCRNVTLEKRQLLRIIHLAELSPEFFNFIANEGTRWEGNVGGGEVGEG